MKRHPPEEPRESAGPLFDSLPPATAARKRGHAAARAAADLASSIDHGWQSDALAAIVEYARTHRTFLTEQARKSIAIPEGADPRAIGHVVKQAARLGFIVASGHASAVSSNGTPKVLWRSLVYEGSHLGGSASEAEEAQ